MTMVWLAWAMLGCGTPDPVQTTDGPLDAPDAEWMVTVSASARRIPPQTWTAWRTGDGGVEAAAGRGAVVVSGEEIEQLETALQAFEAQEARPGVADDNGAVSWTVVVERSGDRVEHSGLALEGPTAELVNAVAIAADHDGSGVLPIRAP